MKLISFVGVDQEVINFSSLTLYISAFKFKKNLFSLIFKKLKFKKVLCQHYFHLPNLFDLKSN